VTEADESDAMADPDGARLPSNRHDSTEHDGPTVFKLSAPPEANATFDTNEQFRRSGEPDTSNSASAPPLRALLP
jgi:hypothetical protein